MKVRDANELQRERPREAMVFAAGLGTRLGAIARDTPKCLLQVGDETILDRVCESLALAGVERVVVNVHRHLDQFEAWRRTRPEGAPEVVFALEAVAPLETGGGLAAARSCFVGAGPLLLVNGDVLTNLPLALVLAAHRQNEPLATLVVSDRPSRRGLLFDAWGLCGRVDDLRGRQMFVREPQGAVTRFAFQGLHAIDRRLLACLGDPGPVSIIEPYLRLAGTGERLLPYLAAGWTWLDVGTPEGLAQARRAW